jgi:hypothetical protein
MKYTLEDIEKTAKLLAVRDKILGKENISVSNKLEDNKSGGFIWTKRAFDYFKEFLPDLTKQKFYELSRENDLKHLGDEKYCKYWDWR